MKHFYEPVLFADIVVKIEKPKNDIWCGSSHTEQKKTKNGTFVRYVLTLENKKDFYVLIHECLHLVRRIFTDRDIPFNETNDELIAYYQSYLVKRIWKYLSKKNASK